MKNFITIFIMLVAVGCGKSNSITEDEENGILRTTVGVLSNEIKRLEAENENLKEAINKLKEKGGKEDESIEPVKKLTAEEKKLLAVMKDPTPPASNLSFLKMENQRNGLMVRS
jgi:archaellum component FlaC